MAGLKRFVSISTRNHFIAQCRNSLIQILDDTLPVVKPNFESGADLAVTWIGHATVLVQMEGIAFITDPIWVPKASPFSFVGPGRYRPAPCAISELPEVQIPYQVL